jgi:hypothetical protein
MNRFMKRLLCLWAVVVMSLWAPSAARADELPEYRLKTAFLYNFIVFTEWPLPLPLPPALNVCIYGDDPFGKEIDALNAKPVGARSIAVQRKAVADSLDSCQVVFVAPSAINSLPQVVKKLSGRSVLVVADSPGAARHGAALNMAVTQNKVTFEANVQAAREAQLTLSSKLLRLATEVQQ